MKKGEKLLKYYYKKDNNIIKILLKKENYRHLISNCHPSP
jgi:hypothetical protein